MKQIIPASKQKVISITCDRCEKTYISPNDDFEIQEFLSFSDTAGYGSRTFEDCTRWSIDLCQYCVKEVLGQWVKIHGNHITDMRIRLAQDQLGE